MLALADWCDDSGRCFPSIGAIAKKIRVSRSQAQRTVHRLIDKGFLLVIDNANGGPPGSTRRYRLVLEQLTGATDANPTGRMDATGSTDATGRMDAEDGPHGCAETGRMDATQTVIEPSVTVRDGEKPSKPARIADCPHEEIISLFHEVLPTARQVRTWTPTRAQALRARWREKANRQDLEWWRRFFEHVSKSDFLMGRTHSQGRPPFDLSLAWLIKPENFAKVIEGAYDNRSTEVTP